jgi:hypothetical protein
MHILYILNKVYLTQQLHTLLFSRGDALTARIHYHTNLLKYHVTPFGIQHYGNTKTRKQNGRFKILKLLQIETTQFEVVFFFFSFVFQT